MSVSEDALIGQYAPLVRRQALLLVAKLPASVELDDLMQAGMMGLLDAVRRYQQQPGAQFETYAVTRVRGAMLDELRSQDWLPRSARGKARSIEEAVKALNHRLLRPANEAEIAEEMGLDIQAYQSMLEDARGVQVLMYEDLAKHREDSSSTSLLDLVADDQARSPLAWLEHQGLREALAQAIRSLPEREQLLLSLQFEQDLNQKEIAAVLGITEGRVSQLRSQAVLRIRACLADHSWDDKPDEGDYLGLL
ncbi:MAG: RNA polymerase sigma factor FliA [Alcaligenaceae bacterium]|nr:RNA polymerase sigma factor FliA [Alcaligenaceae bacterium]